ncbi:unnamed protein product [Didymodactylos carnosus]|uniref:Methionine aminopeptidase n=1 Tax=Didymodactylos carnosus TaxID=1234261 RepID=A0A8S2CWT4_9BILA|nr:unnamed protein product [Didymodactylos carnosus]CAF3532561.1 unnamed protein product [Didymodactylos carnosus]
MLTELKPGANALALDQQAGALIRSLGAEPTFLGYRGFARNICISLNDEVIHGVAKASSILKDGDLITLDIGVTYQGYVVDAAFSHIIGSGSAATKRINQVTQQALADGIAAIKPGVRAGAIGAAIQQTVESNGYFLLEDFTGHGSGLELHEDPAISNFGPVDHGPKLKPNMTICIEPMVMTGSNGYVLDPDDG